MSWIECEPKPGSYSWGKYLHNAELLQERGVKVSGVYHNAPAWARANTEKLPGKLTEAYDFSKKLAEAFRGKMAAWEFWNEEDIGFAPESAWDYASAMKAAYLGFKAGDPGLQVALGGIAHLDIPLSNYCNVLMENGLSDYFDIFNVHTYQPLKEFPGIMLAKAVEDESGKITVGLEQSPAGEDMIFIPCPGGQMKFHILFDEVTQLFWLLSTQSTDSMVRPETLPPDRFNLPNNERRRLQLHFSKNCIDWCFAGLVAVGDSEKQSRHYASMAIDGDDLRILSRSGDGRAKSAHNGNLITFHTVKKFRDLVY